MDDPGAALFVSNRTLKTISDHFCPRRFVRMSGCDVESFTSQVKTVIRKKLKTPNCNQAFTVIKRLQIENVRKLTRS